MVIGTLDLLCCTWQHLSEIGKRIVEVMGVFVVD